MKTFRPMVAESCWNAFEKSKRQILNVSVHWSSVSLWKVFFYSLRREKRGDFFIWRKIGNRTWNSICAKTYPQHSDLFIHFCFWSIFPSALAGCHAYDSLSCSNIALFCVVLVHPLSGFSHLLLFLHITFIRFYDAVSKQFKMISNR